MSTNLTDIALRTLNPFEQKVPHPRILNVFGEKDRRQQLIGKLWQLVLLSPLAYGIGYQGKKLLGRTSKEYKKAIKPTKSSVVIPSLQADSRFTWTKDAPSKVPRGVGREKEKDGEEEGQLAPKQAGDGEGRDAGIIPSVFRGARWAGRPYGATDYLVDYTQFAAPILTLTAMLMLGGTHAAKGRAEADKKTAERNWSRARQEYDEVLTDKMYPEASKQAKDKSSMIYGDTTSSKLISGKGLAAIPLLKIPYLLPLIGLAQLVLFGGGWVAGKRYLDLHSEPRKDLKERKKALKERALRRYVPKLELEGPPKPFLIKDRMKRIHGIDPEQSANTDTSTRMPLISGD